MPHISKQKISEKIQHEFEKRLVSLITDASSRTRRNVLRELLTKTERLMIAKRLALLFLIHQNTPTHTISALLGMSPSTVARFETKAERGVYKKMRAWFTRYKTIGYVTKLLEDLARVPLTARRISLARFLDENL